jgi:uncharacterized membrane protein
MEAFMDTGDKDAHVTQRECNSALTLVWGFIMLAISITAFRRTSPTRDVVNVIYLATAMLMVVTYGASSLGGRASRKPVLVALVLAAAAAALGMAAYFRR